MNTFDELEKLLEGGVFEAIGVTNTTSEDLFIIRKKKKEKIVVMFQGVVGMWDNCFLGSFDFEFSKKYDELGKEKLEKAGEYLANCLEKYLNDEQ